MAIDSTRVDRASQSLNPIPDRLKEHTVGVDKFDAAPANETKPKRSFVQGTSHCEFNRHGTHVHGLHQRFNPDHCSKAVNVTQFKNFTRY